MGDKKGIWPVENLHHKGSFSTPEARVFKESAEQRFLLSVFFSAAAAVFSSVAAQSRQPFQ